MLNGTLVNERLQLSMQRTLKGIWAQQTPREKRRDELKEAAKASSLSAQPPGKGRDKNYCTVCGVGGRRASEGRSSKELSSL